MAGKSSASYGKFGSGNALQWQGEVDRLRKILLDCQLSEELKWGWPCYTFQRSNIVLINGFKEYCALLFFKGALLKDAKKILNKIGENTQAGRQIRFTNVRDIVEMEPVLKAYIHEAIEIGAPLKTIEEFTLR